MIACLTSALMDKKEGHSFLQRYASGQITVRFNEDTIIYVGCEDGDWWPCNAVNVYYRKVIRHGGAKKTVEFIRE